MSKIEKVSRFLFLLGMNLFLVVSLLPLLASSLDLTHQDLWQMQIYYSLKGIGLMLIGFILPKVLVFRQ